MLFYHNSNLQPTQAHLIHCSVSCYSYCMVWLARQGAISKDELQPARAPFVHVAPCAWQRKAFPSVDDLIRQACKLASLTIVLPPLVQVLAVVVPECVPAFRAPLEAALG